MSGGLAVPRYRARGSEAPSSLLRAPPPLVSSTFQFTKPPPPFFAVCGWQCVSAKGMSPNSFESRAPRRPPNLTWVQLLFHPVWKTQTRREKQAPGLARDSGGEEGTSRLAITWCCAINFLLGATRHRGGPSHRQRGIWPRYPAGASVFRPKHRFL